MRAISAMDIIALTRTDTTGGHHNAFASISGICFFCNVYTCDTGSLLHEAMFMNQRLSAHAQRARKGKCQYYLCTINLFVAIRLCNPPLLSPSHHQGTRHSVQSIS
ncbi:hypothetical protein P3342_000705 [Pyrenophora teres f. teres]|nr:hypothetical protein P3342_000705 [Pyrenophora teres f. teres]